MIAVSSRDDLDRRPGQRCDLQQDVERVAVQAGEAATEQLTQALGDAQRPARSWSCTRSDELPAELEREEGVASRCLLHADELRSGQLEPELLLEQTMQRAERERAEREPLQPSFREEAVELEGHSRPRAPA